MANKMPIEWHERCLSQWRANIDRNKKELHRLQEIYAQQLKESDFYEQQITEAHKRGMDAFDQSRLLHKKQPRKEGKE